MNIHSCANSCERYYDSPAKLCHRRCQNGYGRNDQEAANSIKKQTVKDGGAPSKGYQGERRPPESGGASLKAPHPNPRQAAVTSKGA